MTTLLQNDRCREQRLQETVRSPLGWKLFLNACSVADVVNTHGLGWSSLPQH
jgi:hypothetical protein